jgi:ABC-type multidrug transport system ATPase subunit/diacylglycerol kinase
MVVKSTQNGANAGITHGFRGMPQYRSSKVDVPAASLIGRILFPFGITFLLPVFVIILVREKEDRIYIMMKMNGLSMFAYNRMHYIHFYIMHIISVTVFTLAGIIFKLDMFVKTQAGVYIILFIIWGHVQIALAFFFASFFSKSRTALLTVFLIVLASVILNSAIEAIVRDGIGSAYFIWPPFAFYRSLTDINTAAALRTRSPYKMSTLVPGNTVFDAMLFMIVESFLLFGLAAYLARVLPSEYGIQKPWHFIFSEPYNKYFGGGKQRAEHSAALLDDDEVQFEDDDVKQERSRVLNNQYPPDAPLVMKNMRKLYNPTKIAVKDVTLAVENNSIFGLLGPNGAGKTTLISILTGVYEPTSGTAMLNGYNIMHDMDAVYKTIGICPQHDILWGDLTVLEHLLFYARLKGATPAEEMEVARQAIKQVDLQTFQDRLAKGLSGGERRRLSIAIALTGNPGVVFLDEPTTGLDPEVKRIIWNIVQQAKSGRTIVLTTHSMEEAEVLCQRIGIMAKGTLRCIGTTLHLKQQYGRGFLLHVAYSADQSKRACTFVETLLPAGWRKVDDYSTSVSYEFQLEQGALSHIFQEMEAHKHDYGIDDWGLSQTSLEEVFLHIIQEADAQAD